MSYWKVKKLSRNDSESMCVICRSTKSDHVYLGDKFELSETVVHHYCMLSATNLKENNDELNGIHGFPLADIKKEITHTKLIKCTYCEDTGASTKCRECGIRYHLPCGLMQSALFAYNKEFFTLCVDHRPLKNLTDEERLDCLIEPKLCFACFEPITALDDTKSLKTPCCRSTWCHRHCAMQLAIHQGLLFNCPVCRNTQEFQNWAKAEGIFFPQRVFPWEFDLPATQLQRMEIICSTIPCKIDSWPCRTTHWEFMLCSTCGSNGTHRLCANMMFGSYWQCELCKEICARIDQRKLEKQRNLNHEEINQEIDTAQPPAPIQEVNGTVGEHQGTVAVDDTNNHKDPIQTSSTNQKVVKRLKSQSEEPEHNMDTDSTDDSSPKKSKKM